MEQFPPRHARRAASHGALNGAPPRPPQFNSFRPQALKSVSERAGFLAPPGPLQSMLKTTTETGDIGIFSIGPVGSSSVFQHRPRARTGISEGNRPRRNLPRGGPRPAMYDDRRRLPSFTRDSTSEILSLYGSEASRSGCSSLTRRFDDSGPRSYSLTSCTSRQLQNVRTSTMTSSCSSSGFQRPRSPYPYPTRLKRPGFRPSSPAIAHDGRVDYSRMVGIDHVSHRTVHGSYRPVFPSQLYQRPPGSMRTDGNPPSRYEPHYGSYPSRRPPDQRGRPYYSSQSGQDFAEGPDFPPSHNSQRASSLTSLSNSHWHHGLTSHRQLPRPQPPRLLYYDGSEEFEDTAEQIPAQLSPIAPIPTRAAGSHRPMVLREDCEEHLQPAPNGGYSAYESSHYSEMEAAPAPEFHSTQLGYETGDLNRVNRQPADNSASRIPPASTSLRFEPQMSTNSIANEPAVLFSLTCDDNASELGDTTTNGARIFAKDLPAQSMTPERRVEIQSPGKTTIRSVRASILESDDHDILDDESLCTILSRDDDNSYGAIPRSTVMERGEPQPSRMVSLRERPVNVHTQNETHRPFHEDGDFSFAPTRSGTILQVRRPGDARLPSRSANEQTDYRKSFHSDSTQSGGEGRGEGGERDLPDDSLYPLIAGNDRVENSHEFDYSRKATTRAGESTIKAPGHAPARSRHSSESVDHPTTPVVIPRPISPMKERQLKNTVPQLMKALPPIPTNTQTLGPNSLDTVDELTTEILKPAQLTPQVAPRRPASRTVGHISVDETEDSRQRTPKLKLRLKNSTTYSSTCTTESRPWNTDKNYPWMADSLNVKLSPTVEVSPSSKYSRPRLKLRVSRSTIDGDDDDANGTVKRTTGTDRSTSISDLVFQQPRDLFNWPEVLDTKALQPMTIQGEGHSSRTHQTKNSEHDMIHSSTPATFTARDRSTRVATSFETCVNPTVHVDFPMPETQAERGPRRSERRRLKKCRSLKSHIAEWKPHSPRRSGARHEDPTTYNMTPTRTVSSDSDMPRASDNISTPSEKPRVRRSGRLRRKLSRWMVGAKNLMAVYSKKRRAAA